MNNTQEMMLLTYPMEQIADEIIHLKVTLELEQRDLMRRKALLLNQIDYLEKLKNKNQNEEL